MQERRNRKILVPERRRGRRDKEERRGGEEEEQEGKEETVTVGLSYKPALTTENTRIPSTLTDRPVTKIINNKEKSGCFKHTYHL